MCGIAGIRDRDNVGLAGKMADVFTYRGPDENGGYIDKEAGVGLSMRRLSIIDLKSGHQPMSNEDGSLQVVCNGEIYNSPELRARLVSKGHVFRTENSDVEVLVHLFEEKGADCVHDLNGMFSFVIYDSRKRIFFGARDRIGIKPFYYACKDARFAFASELKSLLVLPWVSREINRDSLYHYISMQFVPAPESIFDDIHKLPAGHWFMYDVSSAELIIKKYWDLRFDSIEQRAEDAWVEILRAKLKEAVNRWTLSDVPIACSLSGGLDSASLVGILVEAGIRDLRTYSLGFGNSGDQGCDEFPLARLVAKKWGTRHREVVLDPERVLQDLERMVWHLDEPYAGGLPSWYIYELVSRDVKVCMTGTGGDELFGNYSKYRIYEQSSLYRMLKTAREVLRCGMIPRCFKDAVHFPAGHFYPRYFSDAVKDEMIFLRNGDLKRRTEQYIEELWKSAGIVGPRNAVAYVDFKMQLPEEFLHVTDRFSMAHSVEARVPFLDHEFVEMVFRVPPIMRTGGREPKSLLKRITGYLLPVELLSAPKRGFILPLDNWTRNELRPLVEELLSPSYLRKQSIFSDRFYNPLVKAHLAGKADYTQQVWTLLMFQLWHKKYCK